MIQSGRYTVKDLRREGRMRYGEIWRKRFCEKYMGARKLEIHSHSYELHKKSTKKQSLRKAFVTNNKNGSS